MKNRTPLALAALVVGSAALVAGLALPATADPSADTTTTFTLDGGSLSITAQPDATLTNAPAGTTDISGSLGDVEVTDATASQTGWLASASSTEFVGTDFGSSSTAVTYDSGDVGSTGTSNAATEGATAIDGDGGAPVVSATDVSGDNTATWDPTLNVTMPAGALADDYSGTVTTSVS
jgi:hypothetical protein